VFPGSVRFHVGDIVELRKTHPCGGNQWEITRTGMDFGLKCVRCGRRILIPRVKFEKLVKRTVRYAVEPTPAPGGSGGRP